MLNLRSHIRIIEHINVTNTFDTLISYLWYVWMFNLYILFDFRMYRYPFSYCLTHLMKTIGDFTPFNYSFNFIDLLHDNRAKTARIWVFILHYKLCIHEQGNTRSRKYHYNHIRKHRFTPTLILDLAQNRKDIRLK